MGVIKDLSGKRFGRLTAVKLIPDNDIKWFCTCECGNIKIVKSKNLLEGSTRSCGCLKKEQLAKVQKNRTVHLLSKSPLYFVWYDMIRRCLDPSDEAYANYGGRGIEVCEKWKDLQTFAQWAENSGYCRGLLLDRINNSLGYSPDNCRWATFIEQQRNKRTNKFITINGETKTMTEWAETAGISQQAFYYRLKAKWSGTDLLRPKAKHSSQY